MIKEIGFLQKNIFWNVASAAKMAVEIVLLVSLKIVHKKALRLFI
jgi:hypothetical protein